MTLALCSCRKEGTPPGPVETDIRVEFNVTLPAPVHMATRAGIDTDVENIDLLIFDESSNFIERISVDEISGDDANKTFTALLDASESARTIHIVANGRTAANADRVNFSYITIGMSEDDAIPALVTNPMTVASEGAMTPLVMWGRKLLPSISSSTTVGGIALLRSLAMIQVGKDTPTASNGLGNFEITSATLHSASSRGKVTPFIDFSTNVTSAPNEVATPRINYYTSNGYISTGANPVLYLYERENSLDDHMSLIIGGEWNGTPGYYKFILTDDDDEFYQIIRNHRYIVTVIRASGAGFPTIQQAVENEASNIEIEITDSNDELHFIYGDATTELGASDNVLRLYGGVPNNTLIDIATVFATQPLSSSNIVTDNVTALTNLEFVSVPNGLQILRGRWSNTNTAIGTITIQYGKLSHTIHVEATGSIRSGAGGWQQGAGQTTYCPVFTAVNKPWFAQVTEGANNTNLGTVNGQNVKYGDPGSDYTSLNSADHGDTAYMYVNGGKSGGSGRAVIKVEYISGLNYMKGQFVKND